MNDHDKMELFDSYLRVRGTILLSADNAEIYRRTRPLATFKPDAERPHLLRVQRAERYGRKTP